MKLAVTGKGGVGKTTTSALLALALSRRGHSVIAIDADPDANLAACLGYPLADTIRPLVEMKDLIAERTGVKPGTTGGMFQLNPRVEDIPERFGVMVEGIRVLVAGAVKKGGAGCYCPENALVRSLVSHLLLEPDTDLILDMEAGIEHLSRGTIDAVDQLLIVAEPAPRSIETARRIRALAADVKLTAISVIGNRIRSDADRAFLRASLSDMNFAGFIPHEEALRQAERNGRPPAGVSPAVDAAVAAIAETLAQATTSMRKH